MLLTYISSSFRNKFLSKSSATSTFLLNVHKLINHPNQLPDPTSPPKENTTKHRLSPRKLGAKYHTMAPWSTGTTVGISFAVGSIFAALVGWAVWAFWWIPHKEKRNKARSTNGEAGAVELVNQYHWVAKAGFIGKGRSKDPYRLVSSTIVVFEFREEEYRSVC